MARWSRPEPEAEGSEEAQTLIALNRYAAVGRLRMADPPIPGVGPDIDVEDVRRICAAHPDHPAVVRALGALKQADEIEEEASR